MENDTECMLCYGSGCENCEIKYPFLLMEKIKTTAEGREAILFAAADIIGEGQPTDELALNAVVRRVMTEQRLADDRFFYRTLYPERVTE